MKPSIGLVVEAKDLSEPNKTPFIVTISDFDLCGITGKYTRDRSAEGLPMFISGDPGYFAWKHYDFFPHEVKPEDNQIVQDTIKWLRSMPRALKEQWAQAYPRKEGMR